MPILVGSVSEKTEARFGAVLAPYLAAENTFFVISSDFCHWCVLFAAPYVSSIQFNKGNEIPVHTLLHETYRCFRNSPCARRHTSRRLSHLAVNYSTRPRSNAYPHSATFDSEQSTQRVCSISRADQEYDLRSSSNRRSLWCAGYLGEDQRHQTDSVLGSI